MASRKILYKNSRGHITMEPTGKSLSYFVWMHGVTAAKHVATFGVTATNAFARAKERLESL